MAARGAAPPASAGRGAGRASSPSSSSRPSPRASTDERTPPSSKATAAARAAAASSRWRCTAASATYSAACACQVSASEARAQTRLHCMYDGSRKLLQLLSHSPPDVKPVMPPRSSISASAAAPAAPPVPTAPTASAKNAGSPSSGTSNPPPNVASSSSSPSSRAPSSSGGNEPAARKKSGSPSMRGYPPLRGRHAERQFSPERLDFFHWPVSCHKANSPNPPAQDRAPHGQRRARSVNATRRRYRYPAANFPFTLARVLPCGRIREVSSRTPFVELMDFLKFSRPRWPPTPVLFVFYAHFSSLSRARGSCLICAAGRTLRQAEVTPLATLAPHSMRLESHLAHLTTGTICTDSRDSSFQTLLVPRGASSDQTGGVRSDPSDTFC